ncbi:hypothetical protein AHF37_07325 [Paragonimus kellicotti]|nr:hypothetical protein AHF37_07325 [Paragonimus kellicotti]
MLNKTKKNVEFKRVMEETPSDEPDFAYEMKTAVRTGNVGMLRNLATENLRTSSQDFSETRDFVLDKADANVWFRDNLTPLHLAAKYGIPSEERETAEKSSDSDQVAAWHLPDIHGVIHNQIIHLLVEQGAYLECKDQNGMTALHHAVMRNNLNCVMQLISEGADLNFHHACYHGNEKIIDIIYKHLKQHFEEEFAKEMLNSKNIRMETPLHLAILSKSFPATEYCLDSGADISAVTFQQETALHLAARSGNMNIVEALLKRKLEVNEPNNGMQTPLFYAIEGGHIYVVERLLNRYCL